MIKWTVQSKKNFFLCVSYTLEPQYQSVASPRLVGTNLYYLGSSAPI